MLPRRLFLLVYGVSGAAALIYEVTWTRLLTLQMGHGVAAASTVLAAFMGGLAVGSAVGGRFGGRLTPAGALRLYAIVEVAIAALALLLPLELSAVRPWLASAYDDGNPGVMFPLLRLASSLLLLAVPAMAMGATFPIASRWMVQDATRAAADAGWLYAVNTIGATLGAVLAGFVLLPALGLRQTIAVGVVLNLIAATVTLLIAARAAVSSPVALPVNVAPARRSVPSRSPMAEGVGLLWTAAIAMGLSGGASLALQVVWTRLAALILGPTTYAFSVVVTVFVGGLAAGSALGVAPRSRSHQPVLGLAVCLLSSVGLAIAAACGVDRALLVMAEFVANEDVSFSGLLIRQALLVVALLAPMTLAFGAAFPFAVAVGTKSDEKVVVRFGIHLCREHQRCDYRRPPRRFRSHHFARPSRHDSRRVTLSLLAVRSLYSSSHACRAAPVWSASPPARWSSSRDLRCRSWNQPLLSSGVYKSAPELGRSDLETWLTAGRLLYYREGATATVSVREALGNRSLSIDGKVDASNGQTCSRSGYSHICRCFCIPNRIEWRSWAWAAALPWAAALKHPITRADVLEISPEVVEASRFFESGESSSARRSPHAPDRWRRSPAFDAHPVAIRCDCFGAVESLDRRHRFTFHARVLRIGAGQPGTRRSVVPVGAHLRHQRQRPSIDRGNVSVGVPRRLSLAHRQRRRPAGGIDRTTRQAIRRDGASLGTAGGRE